MHSDDMEEIDGAGAGEVVAMFGVDCSSMDTFSDGNMDLVMSSMFVPVSCWRAIVNQPGFRRLGFSLHSAVGTCHESGGETKEIYNANSVRKGTEQVL